MREVSITLPLPPPFLSPPFFLFLPSISTIPILDPVTTQGVGRRSLKSKLILEKGDAFGTTIPTTSREMREGEEDGKAYWFTEKLEMEQDIVDGKGALVRSWQKI